MLEVCTGSSGCWPSWGGRLHPLWTCPGTGSLARHYTLPVMPPLRSGSSGRTARARMEQNGYNVYKWNGTEFVKQKSFRGPNARSHHHGPALGGERSKRHVHAWWSSALPTKARDIAVGPDNSVWIIGTDQRGEATAYIKGRPSVPQRNHRVLDFTYADFAAVRIAVDKSGRAWVVNETGEVYMYDIASRSWGKRGRRKHDRFTQALPAAPFGCWEPTQSRAVSRSTSGIPQSRTGNPMALTEPWKWPRQRALPGSFNQTEGCIQEASTQQRTPAPVDLTQTWPPPTPQEPWFRCAEAGKLLCSDTAPTLRLR